MLDKRTADTIRAKVREAALKCGALKPDESDPLTPQEMEERKQADALMEAGKNPEEVA